MIRIPLTQGLEAIVDDCDARFAEVKWHAHRAHRGTWYARRTKKAHGKKTVLYLHREILGVSGKGFGVQVDHVNGDGLDCRRANVRVVSLRENRMNSRKRSDNRSGYKGVSWWAHGKTWRAQIRVNGENVWLGNFDDPEAAHRAYVEAARRHFGEYARTE